jgi:hypothetical protein
MWINNCTCGSNEFLIICEKIYEGEIEDGILKCVPDNEAIIEVKCRKCQKEYNTKSFREISY